VKDPKNTLTAYLPGTDKTGNQIKSSWC